MAFTLVLISKNPSYPRRRGPSALRAQRAKGAPVDFDTQKG
ncbi:hypothetical protein COXBURSA331_A0709 [Coxiella burnetii RSA 331]|nr:hypothetical protein COXBURSA331_A0709 [Coxiella burnetii RSA 331]